MTHVSVGKVGKGTTSFAFPSYTPTAEGTFTWIATIVGVDPDDDTATATALPNHHPAQNQ